MMGRMAVPSDLRDAWRTLARRPGFSLGLLGILGLGIGAATTIFSFVYALLLRPYPYHEPDRLVRVQSVATRDNGARRGCSLRDVEDYGRRATRLDGIGAFVEFSTRLLTDGPPEIITMAQINAPAFALLGVRPQLGRALRPEEDSPGGDVHKAVIAHHLWLSRFSADPHVIGKTLRTDRQTYTIVGVMPPAFRFPERADAWTPMESWYALLPPGDDRREKRRGDRFYATIARVKPGVSLAEAEADLNAVAASLEREFPADNAGVRVALTPLRTFDTGAVRPYLVICVAGVAAVLLIACVNVANLLLVRAAGRRREMAVKMALGASASRLARGLIVESLLLGLSGAALGLLLAIGGVRALLALVPVTLPAWVRVEVDLPVLAFAMIAGVATALLFGVAPVLASARLDVTRGLREGARGSARSRLRSTLVIAEIALSVVLLVSAGLLMQTFLRLQARDPGFDRGGVALARVVAWAPGSRTQSAAALTQVHGRVLAALRALPGVSFAAVSNDVPFTGSATDRIRADIYIRGRAAEETRAIVPISGADVSAGYFEAMRIPLRRGRLVEPTDTTQSEPVVIISERAAARFWRGQDPIGQYISWGKPTAQNPWTRVVGIVGNVKHQAAEGEEGIEFYYPITQWPVTTSYYVVRTSGDPEAMLAVMRKTILTADPTLAVRDLHTLARAMSDSLWQRRLWGVLFGAFSIIAVGLAAAGVYGVVSHAVTQRAREMAIRLALGARPSGVRALVLRESLWLCALGAAAGVAGALLLGRALAGLLFGVAPYDPWTYASVLAIVVLIGLAASWLPARRASRVNPIAALRNV